MVKCLPLLSIVLFVCIFGCDNASRNEEAARLRDQREEEQRLEREKAELSSGLAKYADAKLKLLEDSRKEIATELSALKTDAEALSRAMTAAEMGLNSKGEEFDLENKLLRMMKDPEINRLAQKYLASDFSLDVSTYIEKIRVARAQEAKYNSELQHMDSVYKETVETAAKWSKASKEQREAEISRLKQELVTLEKRKAEENRNYAQQGKRALAGGRETERGRAEVQAAMQQRINDIDHQIGKKRFQLDYLLNPHNVQSVESLASRNAQNVQWQAANLKRDSLYEIQKMKPKMMVTDVVEEYAGRTVGAVKKVIADKINLLSKKESDCRENINSVKEIAIAIPISSLSELRSLRARLDKFVR